MRVIGVEYIDKKLREMEPKLSKKVLRTALRRALKPAQQVARGIVPKRSGLLRKSLKIRAGKRSKKGITMTVSTSSTDNLYTGKSFYGGFVHDGAKNRDGTKRKGNPFMKLARDQSEDTVRSIVKREILSQIGLIL